MSKNKKIGEGGETIAKEFLEKKGYELVDQNYRHSYYEIDLIMMYENKLIFVEVKRRSRIDFGFPESWVDDKKIDNILKASDQYIYDNDWQGEIRFDIISIVGQHPFDIKHFEDAF